MRRVVFVLLLVVMSAGVFAPASAQEERVNRLYIVDMVTVQVGTGTYTMTEHFGGRYLAPDPQLAGVTSKSVMPFGRVPAAIVVADTTAAENTYLQSLADVIVIGANIDTATVTGGNRQTIIDALEAKNIPGTWVNVGDTYRTVLREIAGYFVFMQKYYGLTGIGPIAQGVSLSTTLGAVAVNNWTTFYGYFTAALGNDERAAWLAAEAQALGQGVSQLNIYKMSLIMTGAYLNYDVSGLNSGTTLRQIFRGLAAQNGSRQFPIGSFVL